MNFNLWHRVSAGIVFVVSTIVFLMTVAPTISFWDCGEFITAAVTMGVPHPPGAPFFQLVGRMFSLLPFSDDLGFRVNLLSTFSSSLAVLFTYLIALRFLRQWKGEPTTTLAAVNMTVAAAIGAFILSWSDTFWFNASEAEVYGIGMFFITAVMWIATEWYFKIGVFNSERSLLLIAYLMGLSIGVHLLSLLALFYVFFLIFFRDKGRNDLSVRAFAIALVAMGAGFFVIYPGIVKYVPAMLGDSGMRYVLLVLLLALIGVVAAKQLHPQLRMVALATLLVTLGFSTYTIVPIRAGQQPALNENAPATLEGLYSYLNRDQYGSYPLLSGPNYDPVTRSINMEKKTFLPRRWSHEHVKAYSEYSSDFEYFLKFQLGHIYLRYFLWNFVGRAGDIQDAPVAFVGEVGDWSESPGYPNRYYAIPFILGLLGMIYHFRKDYRTGVSMAVLFFMMGAGLVLYFNMAEPQVRERDYFFVGSFQVFALWAGLGAYSLIELITEKLNRNEAVGVAMALLLLVAAPVNMLANNYQTHDRHYNYVAFDYAYNLLQSCEKDAILFTGGDNDTFPVWYLQYAAGFRRDVRVVNLSLLNTPWYSKQLKNERPYDALPVNISYSDQELELMRPVQWEGQSVSVPIDPEKIDLSTLKDVPAVRAALEVPRTMSFTVPPTYTDPSGAQGIRNQDILIIDILNNNINNRPIYFALSTAPQDRIGLERNLIVEGMAYRVTPYSMPDRRDRYYPAVNIGIVKKHLTQLRNEPVKDRAYGFMFRELTNPNINLDEASTKMVYSFRVLYMALGQVMMQDAGDIEGMKAVLDKMEKTIPTTLHEFDPNLRIDLASMYLMVGDTPGYLKVAKALETYFLEELKKDPTGDNTYRNPYRVLIEYYETAGEYQKGIDIIRQAQKYSQYGGDPSLEQRVRQYEQWLREGRKTPPAPDTLAGK